MNELGSNFASKHLPAEMAAMHNIRIRFSLTDTLIGCFLGSKEFLQTSLRRGSMGVEHRKGIVISLVIRAKLLKLT